MNNNFFIIHGSYGNPYKNWIPWLKMQLSRRRLNCIVPSFPTPYKQDFESWSKILRAYFDMGYITSETTFITHSLGGIFIVKFLIENKIKVKKIITVAGFNNIEFDDKDLYESFYLADVKLKNINKYCSDIISIYSDNDPYVCYNAAEDFANKLKAKKVVIKNAGHFNEKSSYLEFSELLNYIF